MKSEIAWEFLDIVFKIIGTLLAMGFVVAWAIITLGLFVHLFMFAWSAFT